MELKWKTWLMTQVYKEHAHFWNNDSTFNIPKKEEDIVGPDLSNCLILAHFLDLIKMTSWNSTWTSFSDCKLLLCWLDHWFSTFYIHVDNSCVW